MTPYILIRDRERLLNQFGNGVKRLAKPTMTNNYIEPSKTRINVQLLLARREGNLFAPNFHKKMGSTCLCVEYPATRLVNLFVKFGGPPADERSDERYPIESQAHPTNGPTNGQTNGSMFT